MSNVDAPDVGSGETNIPDLLAEQSGMPNMSSTKTFVVDTNMQVNGDLDVTGTVTATSFIGDGSQLTGISGGTGGGLDSAAVTLLVDSDYVQARETPQDFAYSSLTGAPTALSSFTNDTSYITAADIPTTVDSDYVAARAPAGGGLEGFDVSAYDSATSNGIFSYNVSPGNQIRHLYSLNDAVAPTAYDGSVDYQVSWTMSNNQQFGFRDAGGTRTKVNAFANGTTASTGLVLEGETFNNSGVELVGNLKLSSLPTSDPSEAGLLWNDGGIPVFSGSTAPAGGGLDSAGVQLLIDADLIGSGINSVAVGDQATANFEDAIAIGRSSISSQADTIAMGTTAVASGSRSVAIGNGTDATAASAVALGNSAQALATNAIAIGLSADTNLNADGIAIGSNTEVSGAQGISIGQNAASSQASVAIGSNSSVTTGTETTAIGPFAGGTGSASLALGRGAKANANNTIVLAATGGNSTVATQFGIDIRTSAAGSLTYDTTNDWTFGAGVTMTDLTASGATVVFSNLPTTDPVNAGQLWNDNGTLKVSAG